MQTLACNTEILCDPMVADLHTNAIANISTLEFFPLQIKKCSILFYFEMATLPLRHSIQF